MAIKLGSKVKDKYSGFTGYAISRTEYINGCIQYGVVAKVKPGEEPTEIGIDEAQLEVVGARKPVKRKSESLGGPYRSSHTYGRVR